MIYLIDLDDVLADFNKKFSEIWQAKYPDRIHIPIEEATEFIVDQRYPPELKGDIREIIYSPGFVKSLPPIPGSLEAIQELSDSGKEVFICSSPFGEYKNCVLEKYEWIDEHLGREWVKRLTLTKDKTLVRGDILIDDRPEIKGTKIPTWEHVLYDRPYNRQITDKRRLTWDNYKEVLGIK